MPELEDIELLGEYAGRNSEGAFTTLVERYVNLVYSTALRATDNAHAAQEISQAVFIILARKAKSLGAKTILSGWLYQTTRLTAANYLRGEIRRQKREQEAFMQSTLNETDSKAWLRISPILDDAISKLGARDRDAIVLRFFENKSLGEVGGLGRERGCGENAREPRAGKIAKNFRQARREFDDGDYSRGGFCKFRSSRAGWSGKNNFCRCDCQRRGGGRFNSGFGKRSIENYGMDKNEDNGGCGSGFNSGNRNNDGDCKKL